MPREPWQDISGPDAGRGGRFTGILRRVFGDGENPLNWGFQIFTFLRIRVRIHVFFIVYVLGQLVMSISQGAVGVGHMALGLAALFGLVLLHEFGHCIACRKVDGDADDILMWPLGGLASCAPPHTWQANLITTLGGPAVNAVLLIPLGVVTWLAAGTWQAAVFNPFNPGPAMALMAAPGSSIAGWLLVGLWSLHYYNAILLAFNMLVPMYPMDAGRVVQTLLWRRMGYRRAMEVTIIVGFVAAGVMAVIGIVANETLLLALAVFGGLACFLERRNLRFEADPFLADDGPDEDDRAERAAAKRREREAAEQAKVDAILEKISRDGMSALTRAERRTLDRASKQRGGPAG